MISSLLEWPHVCECNSHQPLGEETMIVRLRQHLTRLATQACAFSVLTATIVLLWRDNLLLLSILLLEAPAVIWLWHDRIDVCSFVILGAAGLVAETIFVRFGVWQYSNPTVLGVPIWFPVAFGMAGLIGQRLSRTAAEAWELVCTPADLHDGTVESERSARSCTT